MQVLGRWMGWMNHGETRRCRKMTTGPALSEGSDFLAGWWRGGNQQQTLGPIS